MGKVKKLGMNSLIKINRKRRRVQLRLINEFIFSMCAAISAASLGEVLSFQYRSKRF